MFKKPKGPHTVKIDGLLSVGELGELIALEPDLPKKLLLPRSPEFCMPSAVSCAF